jgi:hypothetical protein
LGFLDSGLGFRCVGEESTGASSSQGGRLKTLTGRGSSLKLKCCPDAVDRFRAGSE